MPAPRHNSRAQRRAPERPCSKRAGCQGMLAPMPPDLAPLHQTHYENFPVASLLLPRPLRDAVATVYAFARSADDFADEGTADAASRLAALADYDRQLHRIAAGAAPEQPLFARLDALVRRGALPLQPLHDLLSAFSQDVTTHRYADFTSLLDYCRRSANPVGRLMLALYAVPFGAEEALRLRQSDQICTALQLINFWQDVAIDLDKDRIYLPLEDLQRHGVSLAALQSRQPGAAWQSLLAFEVERARAMMQAGAPLALALPGRIGFELRLVVQGGLRILDKIEAVDYDVFRRRPVLRAADWPVLLWRALRMRAPSGQAADRGA